MMADINIYFLACRARTKLTWEASSNDLNLRRILGHANMLDHLTAELVNLGYEWNSDDTYLEDATVVENEPVTPSGLIRWTDQVISGTEGDWDLGSSEDSDNSDSEDSDTEDSSDDSESDSVESFEGYNNGDGTYGKSQISRAHSPKTAIQVTVPEINEFDITSRQKLGRRGSWDKLKAICGRWRQDRKDKRCAELFVAGADGIG
jgi:hypothetical protein